MDKRFEVVLQSINNLQLIQKEILVKLDVREELTATSTRTRQLEKRLDDLWGIVKSLRPASPT